MNQSRALRRSEAGLTLVELMVATVVSGIAISAALAMGYSMMNSYTDHRRTTRVIRAARASLDILSNAVRSASPAVSTNSVYVSITDDDPRIVTYRSGCRGVTPAVDVLNYDSDTNDDDDTFSPTPISPDPDSDELTLIYGAGGADNTVSTNAARGALTTLTDPFSATDTTLLVEDNVGFRDNDLALLVDVDAAEAALIRVSLPNGGSSVELDFGSADGDFTNTSTAPGGSLGPCPLPHTFPATSLVVRARAGRFYVNTPADGIPRLMIDPFGGLDNEGPQPMALGIEDLQVAVGVDDGRGTGTPGSDGSLLFVGAANDDDEIVFNAGNDSLPTAHDANNSPWRALRLTLVARSIEEPTSGAQDVRPAAEDRPAATTQDRFRRRVLRTVVELRNLAP